MGNTIRKLHPKFHRAILIKKRSNDRHIPLTIGLYVEFCSILSKRRLKTIVNATLFILFLLIKQKKKLGPVLVKDMQTKRAVSIFWYKVLRNVLKRMKTQFYDFYFFSYD